MKQYKFKVILTNGLVNHNYFKTAQNESQAIILAQAEAIQLGRGHEYVFVEKLTSEV